VQAVLVIFFEKIYTRVEGGWCIFLQARNSLLRKWIKRRREILHKATPKPHGVILERSEESGVAPSGYPSRLYSAKNISAGRRPADIIMI